MSDDHATAKALYQDYLARIAVLEPARRYAADVAKLADVLGHRLAKGGQL